MLSPTPVAQQRQTATLAVDALAKRFGSVQALQGLSLQLAEGEVMAITGPSGAGKSTLARLISGLESPDHGTITLDGRAVQHEPPQGRRVAHMFESFALYPTRSVQQNVASPLEAPTSRGRWSETERQQRIDDVLALTEMDGLRARLPSQLSGGQKQRVALCRALVQDPSVYVLDEPIGHLDAKLRHRLRGDIRRRQRALRPGTLWLTPDGLEAMAVADRLLVLIGGRVQQIDTPDAVFAQPANVQVARLIGDPAMNVVPLQWLPGEPARVLVGDAAPLPASATLSLRLRRHAQQDRGVLGLRPGALQVQALTAAGQPEAEMPGTTDRWPGTVYAVEPLGKNSIVSIDVGGQRLRAKLAGAPGWRPQQPVVLGFDAALALAFDPDSGALCP